MDIRTITLSILEKNIFQDSVEPFGVRFACMRKLQSKDNLSKGIFAS